jgi:hypothetical protein
MRYCSKNTYNGQAGMCIPFEKEGSHCYPMGQTDLFDAKIDESIKCADIFLQGGNVVLADMPSAAGGAQCSNGICRFCATLQQDCATGRKGPRSCVFPGKLTTLQQAPWEQPMYQMNPDWVWLAIFFPFILCMCCTLCLLLCKNKIPIIGKGRESYDQLLPKT